ncbi:hypothetical protein F5984_23290 [Rudanella paleaurantiibacter]|uniref:Ig-like domain-containing protein n=1 Tax=Rudanella paleaurantiibacter TaxID=2614655 RepID=A0A7J5TT58_9BACT|nr:putative Ig domain-containing protein [Rudanella paleaurantiibacter]KAB7726842.1 hypothetical protein F5984_23290 [Rudanella paleaurantiibacter]
MKPNRLLITFCLSLFFLIGIHSTAQASHAMGVDLTYESIGANQYRVRLKFFRDCNGVTPGSTVSVNIRSASRGTSQNITLTQVGAAVDITPTCPGQLSRCQDASSAFPFGTQQYIYEGTVTLGTPAPDYILSFSLCCRNAVVNTLVNPGAQNIYVETLLNNQATSTNSSPQFNNVPVPLSCSNQPFNYNHGAVDPDGDELVFSLVSALQGQGTLVNYATGFSGTQPLTTTGPVTINPSTGSLSFTPNGTQVAVICIKVEEYRVIGGIRTKIGEVVRDMQFSVLDCNNTIPIVSGINGTANSGGTTGAYSTTIGSGSNACFNVAAFDIESTSLTLSWNNGIPGASFTTNSSGRVGTFCWTPTAADVGTNIFTVTVEDGNCPVKGVNTYGYSVTVLDVPQVGINGSTSICAGGGTTSLTASAAGTWVSSNTAVATVNNAGVVTGVTAGTANFTFTSTSSGQSATTPPITVVASPTATINSSTEPGCFGGNAQFQVTGTSGAILSYTVTGLTGTQTLTLTGSNQVINVASVTTSATLQLLSVSVAGCSIPLSASATVAAPPQLSLTRTSATGSDAQTVCVNAPISAISYAATSGQSVTVPGLPAGVNGVLAGSTVTISGAPTQAGTFNYTVVLSSSCGSTSATGTLTVNPSGSITEQPLSNTALCAGESISTRVLVSGSGPYTYQWYRGSTLLANQNTATLTLTNVQASDAGSYSAVVTGTCTSLTSTAFSLAVSATPTATLSASQTVICAGTSLTLSAGGGSAYTFTGPGLSQSGSNASAVVNQPGTYTVLVTNASGCTAIATTTVQASNSAPTASLAASGTVSCAVPTITLTASPAGATYQFSPGAVQVGGTTGNTARVTAGGVYSVTVTDANGCTNMASVTVAENKTPPNVAISGNVRPLICAGPSLLITASGGGTYQWSTGASTASLNVTAAGVYSVTCTDVRNGCTAVASTTVTADFTPPTVSLSASGTVNCANPTVTLTATPAETSIFRFSTGATLVNNNSATVTTGGVYSVTATGVPNGCTATASTTVSEDKTPPTLSLAASGSVTCANPTVTLTASPAGQGTYRFAGPGLNQTGAGNTATVSAGGLYSVTVTAANGCTATTTTTVESATNAVNATLVASGSLSCANPAVTLTAAPAGASYAFSGPGLNQSGANNTATVSTAGTYSVVVTAAGGCSAVATVTVTGSTSAPLVTINAAPAATVSQGQSVTLTANGATTFLWNTGATTAAIQPPTSVIGTTSYSVTGTAPNGCSANAQITLTVLNPTVFCGADPATLGTPLTLLEPAYNCNTGQIQFRISGGNGAPVTYAAVGITAPTTSCSAMVDTQLAQDIRNQRPNVEPFTITATQNGITVTLRWDARATCAGGGGNTPPTVANPVGPQSATVGVGYSLNVGTVFTDSQTPASLVLSAAGLPAGLALIGSTLTGTPSTSGLSTVTLTATDPGGLTSSTSFQLTVSNPASQTTTPPPSGSALAATLVSYNCSAGAITFGFTGGNGAPVEYLAIGVTGWTTNPSHLIEAGLRLDPKPITIRVRQNGVEGTPFLFDFGAFCAGNPPAPPSNTPPTVANAVGPQSATVGVGFSLNVGSVFTDAQTPGSIVLSASGLPAGLSLNGSTISGTPSASGVSTVILTATDGGSLSNSTSFVLTVSPAGSSTSTPPVSGPLAATVLSYNCQTGAITFGSTGGNGATVEYFAIGITGWTTNSNGTIEAGLRADPKPVTIRVRQNGVEGAPFVFDFGAFCSRPARVATEALTELEVMVLGNPTGENWVDVEVGNPAGEALQLRVISAQGRLLSSQTAAPTRGPLRQRVQLGTGAGTYLLQVATPTRQKTVKVLRQ